VIDLVVFNIFYQNFLVIFNTSLDSHIIQLQAEKNDAETDVEITNFSRHMKE